MHDFLRHPLVVGAALTLLSALLASVLFPALTRVWQDRPKELALKREIVGDISRSATTAIAEAKADAIAGQGANDPDPEVRYARMNRAWTIDSALVAAQLATYFPDSQAARDWNHFIPVVTRYLGAAAFVDVPKKRERHLDYLESFLKRIPSAPDTPLEATPQRKVEDVIRYDAPLRLYKVRDLINAEVMSTPAAGFSHGVWIFK